jgi:hypothetical protein
MPCRRRDFSSIAVEIELKILQKLKFLLNCQLIQLNGICHEVKLSSGLIPDKHTNPPRQHADAGG